ncbi:MAG: DUF3857 domain-containing transglutaminase family protein [Daejeonella sp.]
MKLIFTLLAFSLVCGLAHAQSSYTVSSIPQNILSRASSVIRNSETVYEVKDLDEVYLRKKYAVTILNSAGIDEAALFLNYDKTTFVKSVKGTIYNQFGIISSKIAEKNFQDRSSVSDISLYEDDRVKYYIPSYVTYPFTIEYEYELKAKQSLYFMPWLPINSTGTSLEKGSLTFICPSDFNLRHEEFNYPDKVTEKTEDGKKIYTWSVNNIAAIRYEPLSPSYEEYLTTVKLAPEKFAYKNIKGSFSNWQDLGNWTTNTLLKGRDELPESTKAFIINLVKDISDPKEKAKKIYEFMQDKTRYISVQIGIGGFQPYPAADVDRLGYGDCKGLVNYTHALLKVAGIESFYTIVYGGDFKRDISENFTSMEGNHVILCLPFKNEITWLECTDKNIPFGYLGDFTDDRNVVVCTNEGGKIMRTPKFNSQENKQIRTATFKILEDNSISGNVKTSFYGTQFQNHLSLLNESFKEQVKILSNLYPFPNLQIKTINYKQFKSIKPEAVEVIDLQSYGYCRKVDNKLIIRLNKLNTMSTLKEVSNRQNPVKITRGYYDEDLISYEIPAGYNLNMPGTSKTIDTLFGRYEMEVEIKGNIVIYKRKMHLKEGNYPAEKYQEVVDFFQAIADADNLEVTLLRI